MKRIPTAVIISGRGSNLNALIDASKDPDFPAKICFVVSNREEAEGLKIASAASLETIIIPHSGLPDRKSFEDATNRELISRGIQLICLAGFMRLLTADFIDKWPNRILNIHPALLPSFKGLEAQKQALEAGVKVTGCTVHFVRREVDSGPILAQTAVPILQDDDLKSLSQRILEAEHKTYPLALKLVAEGLVHVEGDIV